MLSDNYSNIVVVSDLDDTLYSEMDYKRSAIKAIIDKLKLLFGHPAQHTIDITLLTNSNSWIECILSSMPYGVGLTKEELLWMYRIHAPELVPYPNVREFISVLKNDNTPFIILTDGRSLTQRSKINALNITAQDILISADYDAPKPNTVRYELVMQRYPAFKYIYIGDNPVKDFQTPVRLGWETVLIHDRLKRNIHNQDLNAYIKESPNGYVAEDFLSVIEIYKKIQTKNEKFNKK